MRTRLFFVLFAAVATALVGSTTALAGKSSTTRTWLDQATIRGAATDALLHDGSSSYSGSDILSYLADQTTTDADGFQDLFYFHVDSKHGPRSISLQDPAINWGAPLPCQVGKVIVKSSTTPDWSHMAVGTTTQADGALQCYVNTRYEGYIIGYPNGGNECLEISRLSDKTWRFAAPPTCDSAVYWQTGGKGGYTTVRPFNSSGVGPTAAEFELTATQK